MSFTRTPLGLNSASQARVIDARAAFVAPYAAPPARPIWPAMLLTLMMLPLPLAAIPGANAATRKNAARTLLANRASNVATSRSGVAPNQRSEEHTSELQSQSNLVCRLLLEKKKRS